MQLALFDLDDTLLTGDSGWQWAQHLIGLGVLERESFESRSRAFHRQYVDGVLDIQEYLRFQLEPLTRHPRETLAAWRRDYLQIRIKPRLSAGARGLVAKHQGDLCAILTATNRYITEPIAEELGIANLLATDPEEMDGRFTGGIRGTPCFREGKIARLEAWLASRQQSLADFSAVWFYSDSANDLPLLERATHPVAVDPDDRLREVAAVRGWPILAIHG